MSEDDKSVPGFWTDATCAYADGRGASVLAAVANPRSYGYMHYLYFTDNECHIQSGPINEREKLITKAVPKEVAESAIKAALGVVMVWAAEGMAKDFGE